MKKKKLHALSCLLFIASTAIGSTGADTDFARGADVNFLIGAEEHGVQFAGRSGKERECMELMRDDYRVTAVRMKLQADAKDTSENNREVLQIVRRAKSLNLDLMVDIRHDGMPQDRAGQMKFHAMKNREFQQLKQDFRQQTKAALTLLKENDIQPQWIQIGIDLSENRSLNQARKKQTPDRYAELICADYEVAKEMFPHAAVVLNTGDAKPTALGNGMLGRDIRKGAGFDMLGISLLPYQPHHVLGETEWAKAVGEQMADICQINEDLGCDVLIVKTGLDACEAEPRQMEDARSLLAGIVRESLASTGGHCKGVFIGNNPSPSGKCETSLFNSDGTPRALLEGFTEDLRRHNFFYTGQSKRMRMFKVTDGQVSWNYDNALRDEQERLRGEISDAVLMTDGNILIAHQYGIAEIDPTGKTVWNYPAPEGTEIHTIQPIGRNHVVFVQNGKPAKVVVMKIPDAQVEREFEIPYSEKGSVHGQFRNARLTSRGTLLIANMAMGCIHEFNCEGGEVNRWDGFLPWSVQELPKGNLLITGRKGRIQEITLQGKTVWEMNTNDYGVTQPQKVVRLKNGNHIINNWYNEWNKTPMDTTRAPVQAIEIDTEGKVVWQLCEWRNPDLGPATTIQLLNDAVNRDRLFFGEWGAVAPKLFAKPNQPIGVGRGIHPGRVAWIHYPSVAKWDGKTGLWVEDRWNDQEKADAMIREAIVQLTGKSSPKKAWEKLFRHFNKTHGRGNRGYRKGETIAIKLNMNNAITHRDTIELNSSPFVTLALVRSLVYDGGVRQQDIVLCEPSRAITDSIYYKVSREFPSVHFIDNIGGDGREKCEYYPEQITYSAENGKMARGLARCIVDADYLINSALLKTHSGPGVTLTSKNWYGATDINLLWRQNAHNNISPDKRNGKPGYKTFVDFISHKDLGQKTLLFLIDGTYGSRDVNGPPSIKWMKEPFNGGWACSLIVSQDEVACDAVGMDIIIGEWPEFGSLNYCDEYLIEAASLPNSPSGTIYQQNGTPIKEPLGIMEHWNNPKERKYTKIDLRYKKIE